MPSPRYAKMVTNLSALRRELLPRRFDPLGNYADRVRARAAGYRLLVHAEIEQYFEDRCLAVALEAVRGWAGSRRSSAVVLGLLAFSERAVEPAPSSLSALSTTGSAAWVKKVDIDGRIAQALGIYSYGIRNNHGVKEANILALLLPLGLHISKIDPTWLADMDSFGSGRGVVAHSSIVRTSIDPESEYSTLRRIIAPIRLIDSELELLK